MKSRKVLPGVYQFPTVAFSYLLTDDSLLVDAAYPLDPAAILEGLDEVGYRPADVKQLVATHCHRDHIGGLAALQERTGGQVVAHVAEVDFIEGRAYLPNRGPVTRLLRRLDKRPPIHVDRAVREGEKVGSYQVLEAPGHTPGNIVLLDEARSLLIGGDAVRVSSKYAGPSEARYNVDHAQAIESFRRLAGLNFENLVAGHGDLVLGGASRVLRERSK